VTRTCAIGRLLSCVTDGTLTLAREMRIGKDRIGGVVAIRLRAAPRSRDIGARFSTSQTCSLRTMSMTTREPGSP
jgi:hypothetical protein